MNRREIKLRRNKTSENNDENLNPVKGNRSRGSLAADDISIGSHNTGSQIPEETQIRQLLESFIRGEKRGLERFYNIPLSQELVDEATDMATKSIHEGCTQELSQSLCILRLYDISILVDDSLSMKITEEGVNRIEVLKTTLCSIVRVYALVRKEGISSINFFSTSERHKDVLEQDIESLLKDHHYSGLARIGNELKGKVLGDLVNDAMERPLLVITMTPGNTQGEEERLPIAVIEECITILQDRYGDPLGAHGIQLTSSSNLKVISHKYYSGCFPVCRGWKQ
ncbi:hypothetical protein FPQ18DRAFT_298089 [Pyronema domesticum]|nr:hypothetical protein FPQ18DRAFT_298089 [Pyronema domesticum]